ncbi:MAG: D-alanyl-D-alanine carboxypeptidase [Gracilibacteraceae bacterium]|jgi:D-alanyl-D-alanine carboxypeptidase (penicillin-binding protein 5/6)|nr:D-alanyl-D-alanine carboxypeptidase [Gracilibacteraceae bacterium]
MNRLVKDRHLITNVILTLTLLALFASTGLAAYLLGLEYLPGIWWGEGDDDPFGSAFMESRWIVADSPPPLAPLPLTSVYVGEGDLLSANAYLLRLSDGGVLLDYDAGARVFPASLTKIMTALVVIESGIDMEETVTISRGLLTRLEAEDASTAGFGAGDSVKVRDLLYGVILPSGAECSEALAVAVAGSVGDFVQMMNTTAYRLELRNTNFSNPTGLHDDSQFSSARDMAELLRYAMLNETFRSVFLTKDYVSAPTGRHPQGLAMQNRVAKNLAVALMPEVFSCKTGYTRQAGICLASYLIVGGEEYIFVTMGAPRDIDDVYLHDLDFIAKKISRPLHPLREG